MKMMSKKYFVPNFILIRHMGLSSSEKHPLLFISMLVSLLSERTRKVVSIAMWEASISSL